MKKRLFAALVCVMMVMALLPAAALADGETEHDISTGSLTIDDGDGDYTITGSTIANTVTVTGGTHKITLDGVSIDVSGVGGCAFSISSGADVTLQLVGNNELISGAKRAGLHVPDGAAVTITGAGSLTADGGNNGAGIGGNTAVGIVGGFRSGTVTISGGTVTATGMGGGAGIGGGAASDGGPVTISGGTVAAYGGGGGAGIGGGTAGDGGTVIISGGNVKATGSTSENAGDSTDIGGGAIGSGGTLTDGNGKAVYRIALTLDGDTPIGGLTAADISSAYGMNDVKPLDGNMLYFYLPEGTEVNSVTTGDTPARSFTNQTGADITVATGHGSTGTLEEVATATISDATVSGTTGTAIAPVSVTVTLTGEKFVTLNKDADVSGWFTNLPVGLSAAISSAVSSGAMTATVAISGTPTAASTAAIAVKIPGNRLSMKKADLTATENGNAKWAIALAAPTVTRVAVNPASVSVQKGGSQSFYATVDGTNDPAQTVTWSVEGKTSASTSISTGGVLSVGSDETSAALTVRATSTVDSTKSGTATVTVTAPPSTVYQIIRGQNGKWTKGSTTGLSFTADGEYRWFDGVLVDGRQVSSGNYTAASGSTVVTLKAAYLETLSTGQHTLRMNFEGGYAETHFTILAEAAVPETGDAAQPMLWLATALLAGALLTASTVRRRSRQNG